MGAPSPPSYTPGPRALWRTRDTIPGASIGTLHPPCAPDAPARSPRDTMSRRCGNPRVVCARCAVTQTLVGKWLHQAFGPIRMWSLIASDLFSVFFAVLSFFSVMHRFGSDPVMFAKRVSARRPINPTRLKTWSYRSVQR
jgi:hypothetical protein